MLTANSNQTGQMPESLLGAQVIFLVLSSSRSNILVLELNLLVGHKSKMFAKWYMYFEIEGA